MLYTATTLSIYKPWGKTEYGATPRSEASTSWLPFGVVGALAIAAVIAILHLAGILPHGH